MEVIQFLTDLLMIKSKIVCHFFATQETIFSLTINTSVRHLHHHLGGLADLHRRGF